MLTCTFFGHRDMDYFPYQDKIEAILIDLIQNCGVTQFYSGYRGNFDRLCAYLVWELKFRYPQIKNTLVLSYLSYKKEDFVLPKFFDDSVYLLETPVPPRFAITHTNRKMVDLAGYVVSGIKHEHGGAFTACKYARKHGKIMIDIYEEIGGL